MKEGSVVLSETQENSIGGKKDFKANSFLHREAFANIQNIQPHNKPNLTFHSNHTMKESERLKYVAKFLGEYKNIRKCDKENKAIDKLEKELAAVIVDFEKEKAELNEEINKLNIEIKRLNNIIKNKELKEDVVNASKIKSLEELLQRMHKENHNIKTNILQLQQLIQQKDKEIDRQNDIIKEKTIIVSRMQAAYKEYKVLEEENKQLKETLKSAKGQLYEALTKLQSLTGKECIPLYNKVYAELLDKVQHIEDNILDKQTHLTSIKNIEQKIYNKDRNVHKDIEGIKKSLASIEVKQESELVQAKHLQESNSFTHFNRTPDFNINMGIFKANKE